MAVESAFPPQTWAFEQLMRLSQRRPELVSKALHRLLAEDPELRWSEVRALRQRVTAQLLRKG